jgi:hypothetical protein
MEARDAAGTRRLDRWGVKKTTFRYLLLPSDTFRQPSEGFWIVKRIGATRQNDWGTKRFFMRSGWLDARLDGAFSQEPCLGLMTLDAF